MFVRFVFFLLMTFDLSHKPTKSYRIFLHDYGTIQPILTTKSVLVISTYISYFFALLIGHILSTLQCIHILSACLVSDLLESSQLSLNLLKASLRSHHWLPVAGRNQPFACHSRHQRALHHIIHEPWLKITH